uniref:Uncharacterized protein n=1 Tax=Arundo donax TaxID=35708 RepID=A0A0A8YDP3_ARUDO
MSFRFQSFLSFC